ncbi:MAG: formylglycine-generating enzyme family protein [Tepidisphaerales bacterium]
MRHVWACSLILAAGLSGCCSCVGPNADRPSLPAMLVQIPQTTILFQMVRIPGGKIELAPLKEGDKPRAEAIRSIWVATTETTWDAFGIWAFARDLPPAQRMAEIGARTRPSAAIASPDAGFGFGDHPAINMTHKAAGDYCQWLSAQTGRRFRLPTEAEWEYACRAGGRPLGNHKPEELDKVAWYAGNSEEATHPVGRKQANAWGLHDMLGNVSEWVEVGSGQPPCVKGGSYRTSAAKTGSAWRALESAGWQARAVDNPPSRWWFSDAPQVGFRVVCEIAEGE